MTNARVWVGPEQHPVVANAVERAGGSLASLEDANAIVWLDTGVESLSEVLHPGIRWVQLYSAGIEPWLAAGVVDSERIWTRVDAVYGPDVAELVVAFLLAAARRLPQAARRTSWAELGGEPIAGRTVGIVGAGAIGRETIARLQSFGVRILALTRSGREIRGADRSLAPSRLDEILAESDYVVLATPLTDETRGMIGARELDLIGPKGWLVNVARGGLVVTEALVDALADGRIAGACLDVTDPEPLPDGHPLWRFENVLVTPHVANPPGTYYGPLAKLVEENVRRFRKGEDLLGVIDPERGY